MFGSRSFRAKYFADNYLAGQNNTSQQGGTFLLALHGTGGCSWGLTYEAEQELVTPRRIIPSVSGNDSVKVASKPKSIKKPKQPKIHLVELYKKLVDVKFKQKLIQEDEDLITLISFMVSNKLIT